jgi:hypothetical protein
MKAIVNIGLRKVELVYSIQQKDMTKLGYIELHKDFKDYELTYNKSKVKCKQVIWFDDIDEWKSTLLFNGKTIDFHYDYEERKEFDSKKDWANYLFQGYEYIFNKAQLFDTNIVKKVIVNF